MPIPLLNWANFARLEALGGGLQMFLKFRGQGTMCKIEISFEFLKVRSQGYLP
jgi:hypothetical protein